MLLASSTLACFRRPSPSRPATLKNEGSRLFGVQGPRHNQAGVTGWCARGAGNTPQGFSRSSACRNHVHLHVHSAPHTFVAGPAAILSWWAARQRLKRRLRCSCSFCAAAARHRGVTTPAASGEEWGQGQARGQDEKEGMTGTGRGRRQEKDDEE